MASVIRNAILGLAVAAFSAVAATAYAQDSMSKAKPGDAMKSDSMSKGGDAMKKDAMGKDKMGSDAMKKGSMGSDAMGKKTGDSMQKK
jgi:pentapeptide MXKDX repeat protein